MFSVCIDRRVVHQLAPLQVTLESLGRQFFSNFEIILAGGRSGACELTDLGPAAFFYCRGLFPDLIEYWTDLIPNDQASQLAPRGDYVIFVEPGTAFEPDALALINHALNHARRRDGALPDFMVFDHDHVSADGRYDRPTCSPGWDPDLICEFDFIGSCFAVSKRFLGRLSAPTVRLGTRYEWLIELAGCGVRFSTARLAEVVAHVPVTASCCVLPLQPANWRRSKLPDPVPSIAVIVPNRDQPDLLTECLSFMEKCETIPIELIIVDHDSRNLRTLAIYDCVRNRYGARIVTVTGPFNFSHMVNVGVAVSDSSVLLLLNNDVKINQALEVERLLAHVLRPEVGVVGSKLLYPDLTVQHAGIILGSASSGLTLARSICTTRHVGWGARYSESGYLGELSCPRNYQAVTGALMMVRRDVFMELNGFDDYHLPIEYNDVDFCLKARKAGYRIVCLPCEGIIHHESITRTKLSGTLVEQVRAVAEQVMATRWPEAFLNDPYDNIHVGIGRSTQKRLG